jgi:hypothetical protein
LKTTSIGLNASFAADCITVIKVTQRVPNATEEPTPTMTRMTRKYFMKELENKKVIDRLDRYNSYLVSSSSSSRQPSGRATVHIKVQKIYHLDFDVAADFALFCNYLDPPLSASQGVQEAMMYYMMVRHKDLVCKAEFIVKPVMVEERQPEASNGVTKSEQCGIRGCKEDAVGRGVWRGKETYALCEQHLQEAKENPKEWKLINSINNSERNDSCLEEVLGHKARTEQP